MGGSAACRRRLGRGRLVRGCARSAGTEKRLRSFWGASGSAAARSRQRGLCSACSLSPHLLSQPSWLPICPPQPAAFLICPPTRPPGAGSRAPVVPGKQRGRAPAPSGSLLSVARVAAALGGDCGAESGFGGLLLWGEKSTPCHSTLHSSLPSGRAWGEYGRPQVRPGFPQLRGACPQPVPRSRQPHTSRS